eukprot:TRINITY_DN3844_c0_g1_i3.p1 TRINITY_DN3844_c0_g1~~TRINITY_DN3844_c0_g1_i3.p1  ORF type:complete len:326 (-),score=42.42 TRINITY_DN3844_c0_g1_i3:656-1633(-)
MSTVRKDALHVQSDLAEREILVVKPSTARHMKRNQIRPTSEEEGEILNRQRRLHRYQSFADTIMKTDQMFAIFIVKFDTHGGNMIEWQSPADIDLSGIEFKAMPSGLHRVEKDFVYFKRGTLFGLAAFHRRMLDGANQERGARMKSVGVLMQNFTNLYVHQSFLEQEVMKQTQHNQVPDYEQLLSYFDTHRQPVISNSELTITHPVGSFFNFIEFYFENIISIWKASMLGMRILFFREPPVGPSAFTVYDTCLLSRHNSPDTAHFYPNPLFYVNVSDLDGLTHESAYIGATTESIFEMKRGIYDIYLKNQTVVYSNEAVENVCKP